MENIIIADAQPPLGVLAYEQKDFTRGEESWNEY